MVLLGTFVILGLEAGIGQVLCGLHHTPGVGTEPARSHFELQLQHRLRIVISLARHQCRREEVSDAGAASALTPFLSHQQL